MHKKPIALLMTTILLSAGAVQADAAPASQFGFKGWPYRQPSNCFPAEPTPAVTPFPTAEPEITAEPAPQPTQEVVLPTDVPTAPTQAPQQTPVAPTAAPTPIKTPAATKAPSLDDDYTTDSLTVQEQKALNLLNQDRIANGLSVLSHDPALSRIARIKSEDMRDNNYFAHESPTYGKVAQMLRTFGYRFAAAGENIAHHATVEKSQAAFMSSSGHRRNILSSSWTKVGIGVCYDRNGFVYVTQIFAR